jgi:DNA polymerase-3 subunit epsilon
MPKLVLSTNPVPPRAVIFDTETTGLSPKQGERIVELAGIELVDGIATGRTFHEYINPEHPVGYHAEAVHGLSNRFLANKPVFLQVARAFVDFVEDAPLFAHNAPFDRRFMDAEYDRLAIETDFDIRCSLQLARRVLGKGSHKLELLAAQVGHKFTGRGAHSAIADCHALGDVLVKKLWPAEAHMAANPGATKAAETKSAGPKTKVSPAAYACAYDLPQGFRPLTCDQDARIRRYDGVDLEGHLTSKGKRWSPDEEARLAKGFIDEEKDLIELVIQHGRTPAALMLKLEGLGVVAPGHPYTRN